MKIGILGGTFDPIHKGHMSIAIAAKEQLALEQIILVPAGLIPHKQQPVTSSWHRTRMAKLAAAEYGFAVSEYEVQKTTFSYTVDTIRHFRKQYKKTELVFIVGGDSIAYIDEWKEWETLCTLCEFAAAGRDEEGRDYLTARAQELREKYGALVHPVLHRHVDISSTALREKIKAGEDVSKWLVPAVYDYIIKNNLYR